MLQFHFTHFHCFLDASHVQIVKKKNLVIFFSIRAERAAIEHSAFSLVIESMIYERGIKI